MNRNLICHIKDHKTSATENPILSKFSLSFKTHSLTLSLPPSLSHLLPHRPLLSLFNEPDPSPLSLTPVHLSCFPSFLPSFPW
jgi:hypothetical protein